MVNTEITIVAPSSAPVDSVVEIEVTIKNISNESINALPGFARADGVSIPFYIEDIQTLLPDASHTWSNSFIMPNSDVTLHVESWWENSLALHKDSEAEVIVAVVAGVTNILSTIAPILVLGLLAGMVLPMVKGGFK